MQRLVTTALALCLAYTAATQVAPTPAAAQTPDRVAAGLTWRYIGPAIAGGRISDLEVVPGTQSHIYVGAASGGVWESVNHGTTWTPIFDDQPNISIGDIALAPSDPLEIWVGTGEANNRNSSPWGQGVYHSSDGGKTWRLTGLEDTRHVGRIVVHPTDPDRVWVAAVGHLFGPNEERGVFRTTDRGATWQKLLYINENTGATDLAMDPSDPAILYAAMYQRQRRAHGFIGGGPGSGIYKSTDGGDTWRELTEGLPEGDMGRIGLAVSRRNPQLVMAVVEAEDGGIFKSTDRGETWTRVNELNQRPMYYSQLRIDPNDDETVYLVAGSLHRTTDGGETFNTVAQEVVYNTGVHVDHHDLWIDPENSAHMILGNDGGLYSTWDRGDNWTFISNIPIQQFYDIDLDMADPYNVYGGLQDNNSYRGPSRTTRYHGILNRDWQVVGYGDGMYAETDPSDTGIAYITSQNAGIMRVDMATGDRKALKPFPRDTTEDYSFDWKSPILVSPHNTNRVYLGGNRLFISDDRGDSWRPTEELTRGLHPDSLPIMGMMPDSTTLSKHDGVSGYGEITAVSESPVTAGVIWVGADDGTVQVSRDDGNGWTDVTANLMAAAGAPPFPYYVSWVETSHFEGELAYVSLDGHWDDDCAPYIFVTEDLGATWRSLTGGLASATVNVVREYHANPNVLIVGAEDGAFASIDRGATWGHLGSGMPAVPVDDIEIHPRDNDVVAGTHGRGIYVLDDIGLITPYLHIESDGVAGTMTAVDEPIFTPPRPATMFLYRNDVPSQGQGLFRAANPAYGAWFDYWLPDAVDEGARFAIHDASGAVVRTLDGPGAPGLNRVTWDLRHDPIPHDTTRYAVPNLDSGPDGPFVLPGQFTVALTVGDERRQQDLTVRPDERLRVSEADRLARYEFTLELHELKRLAYEEGVSAYDLEREASEAVEALEGADDVDEDVLERAKELAAEIEEVADEWRNINNNIRNWWTGLLGNFDGGPSTTGSLTGPSDDQRRRLGRLTDEARVAGERLDEVEGDVIAELRGLSP
ncbi:MAG: YCF48-related protein [Gemmatimonadota bacterium]|nr:YCF48-related protein [Gemmatimonadota bacterium]